MGGYEQYKIDTEVWLSWLIQAAEDNGSSVEKEGEIDASAARSGRLRGMLAQEGHTTTHGQRYLISTEEIQKQARFIANLDSMLTMPRIVWRCYKNCLKTRERYAERFAEDDSAGQLDNEGHRYFNWVLADAHELLKDRVRVRPVAPAPDTEGSSELVGETIGVLYDVLEDVDPNADDFVPGSDSDDTEHPAEAPSTSTIKPIYKPKLSEKEMLRMRLICFQIEADRILDYTVQQWADESLDNAVATLLTEAAVALIGQQAERYYQEFEDVFGINNFTIELGPEERGYIPFIALQAIAASRAQVGSKAYRLPIEPLEFREDPTNLDHYMILKDALLVRYMMDLGLESVSFIDCSSRIFRPC
jgi:hypothetical protein